MSESKKQNFKNIVFSGGGVCGYSYIGVLRALEEYNIIQGITSYAGSSIGAVCAMMLSIGYRHSELYDFIRNFEYKYVQDIQILGVIDNFGIETGQKMERFIQIIIRKKTNKLELTFKEHYEMTGKKLYINAACLDTAKTVYFSIDTHPDMPIYLAVRMSVAIPFLIAPVRWKDHLYVDGGLLDNLPVYNFKNHSATDTLLVSVYNNSTSAKRLIHSFEVYCYSVIECMNININDHKRKMEEHHKYVHIRINTGKYTPFSIMVKKNDRKQLYKMGYREALKILKNNDGLVSSLVNETKADTVIEKSDISKTSETEPKSE